MSQEEAEKTSGKRKAASEAAEEEPAAKKPVLPRNHELTVLLPIDAVGLVIGKVSYSYIFHACMHTKI